VIFVHPDAVVRWLCRQEGVRHVADFHSRGTQVLSDLIDVSWDPTTGSSASSQSPPHGEFETDRSPVGERVIKAGTDSHQQIDVSAPLGSCAHRIGCKRRESSPRPSTAGDADRQLHRPELVG
jgi:hypothetical protein